MTRPLDYSTDGPGLDPALRVAGYLGLGGLGLASVVAALGCGGFDAGFAFSIAVLLLGIAAATLTAVAAVNERSHDSQVFASAVLSMMTLGVGLIELAVWRHWSPLFG